MPPAPIFFTNIYEMSSRRLRKQGARLGLRRCVHLRGIPGYVRLQILVVPSSLLGRGKRGGFDDHGIDS